MGAMVERVGTGIEYPGCSLMVDLRRVNNNNNNNNSNTGVNTRPPLQPHLLNQAHGELADPLLEDVLPPASVDREGHTPAGTSLRVVLRREEGTEDGLVLLGQLLPNDVPQTTRLDNTSNQGSHYTHHSLTLHTLHTTHTKASHYTHHSLTLHTPQSHTLHTPQPHTTPTTASHYTHQSLTLHPPQPHTLHTPQPHTTHSLPNLFLSLDVQSYSLRISCMA